MLEMGRILSEAFIIAGSQPEPVRLPKRVLPTEQQDQGADAKR